MMTNLSTINNNNSNNNNNNKPSKNKEKTIIKNWINIVMKENNKIK